MIIPLGLIGAILFTTLRGLINDVYLQIGLLTTMGLAAKNAILMIEFAEQAERGGASVMDAALEAAKIRLRPILMTSLAFIFGVMPLAISTHTRKPTMAPRPGTFAVTRPGSRPAAVVVTGGHRDRAVDTFFDGAQLREIPGERHPDGAAHGSGCTHASALATFLAHGLNPLDAATRARAIAGEAIANGLRELGAGAGPVDALNVRERDPRVP